LLSLKEMSGARLGQPTFVSVGPPGPLFTELKESLGLFSPITLPLGKAIAYGFALVSHCSDPADKKFKQGGRDPAMERRQLRSAVGLDARVRPCESSLCHLDTLESGSFAAGDARRQQRDQRRHDRLQ
jgi:hypothetical protein